MSVGTIAADGAGDTAIVEETGLGRFQVEARVGSAAFLIDEPVSAGGLGTGPNPYDLLSAALGACTAMTVRLYAERKAWPLIRARVRVTHHRGALQARDTFRREITLEGDLDDTQRARLLEIAQRCPVHLTLERGSDVTTDLVPPERAADGAVTTDAHKQDMDEACD